VAEIKAGLELDKWSHDNYELLQAFQCKGVLSVWAMEDENNPGKHKLEAIPIHFMAVAKVTTRYFQKPTGANYRSVQQYREPYTETRLVGLDLADGYFEVCEEASNFAGYCMEGDDISKATGCLDGKFDIQSSQ
jgi:hypothetical protein